VRALGLFPPGATVELSDRRAALVTRVNTADAQRPQVRVVVGEGMGKRAELGTFDPLEDRHHLSIARAIDPPLVLRPEDPIPSASAVRRAAVAAPVEVTVTEAVDQPRTEIDAPMSVLPPPTGPVSVQRMSRTTGTSGTYSSIREAKPELTTFAPASERPRPGGPTSSMPPSRRLSSPVPPSIERAVPPSAPPPSSGNPLLDKVPVLRLGPSELAKLPLDHRAGFILSFVDAMSSIDAIIDASGMPGADVVRVIEQLVAMKVIELR